LLKIPKSLALKRIKDATVSISAYFSLYDYYYSSSSSVIIIIIIMLWYTGDSLSYHDDMAFSTADMDNDLHMSNCAVENGAGWWFNSCSSSNLNGVYQSTGWYAQRPVSWATATDEPTDTDHSNSNVDDSLFGNGMFWFTLKETEYYSLKRVEMKIKPSD